MKWSGVFLGLLLLAVFDPSGLFDGKHPAHGDCPEFFMPVSPGGPANISIPIPAHISETSFFVQKYNNLTSSWESIILSSNEGSENLVSSFNEGLSFSDGWFKMENVSKGAEDYYRILDHMYGKCVAIIYLTKQELESSTAASGTSGAEEEPRDEAKGGESGFETLHIAVTGVLVGLLVVLVALLFFLLYKCCFVRTGTNLLAYSQHIFSKLTHHSQNTLPSQQTKGLKDSQEREEVTMNVHDTDRDGTQGTREKQQDSFPETCEAHLLIEDRDRTQQPRERDLI